MNVLWEWRFAILVFFLVALLPVLLGWQRTKILLYQLMLQAKRLAKDAILKSGQEQEEWVVRKTLLLLPRSWRLVLSEKNIRRIVKWLYYQAKDYADDGKFNSSI